MTMPNFLLIGAAKSGSSALYHHLRQHPDVFMPEMKEPKFWGTEGHAHDAQGPDKGMNSSVRTLEAYEALFEGVGSCHAIGEATPYLGSPTAPVRIRAHIPGARLIALLRHPADRAFSAYCHMLREGIEPYSFERGLEEEERRIAANWSPLYQYTGMGWYGRDLGRWFEQFPRAQFRVYLYEDFRSDPIGIVSDAFRFLGVDPDFEPRLAQVNVSGVPRSRVLYDLFRRDNLTKAILKPLFPRRLRARIQEAVRKRNLGPKPELNPETRRRLVQTFREDILLLQGLLQRDLSHWLTDVRPESRPRRPQAGEPTPGQVPAAHPAGGSP